MNRPALKRIGGLLLVTEVLLLTAAFATNSRASSFPGKRPEPDCSSAMSAARQVVDLFLAQEEARGTIVFLIAFPLAVLIPTLGLFVVGDAKPGSIQDSIGWVLVILGVLSIIYRALNGGL
ncbi:MAG TPA: hypothetical protein VHR45_17715 [Thermoanaerobaculia bacterium]|nr:hypothetical protein [Thermoanaerobaculia bacterium]